MHTKEQGVVVHHTAGDVTVEVKEGPAEFTVEFNEVAAEFTVEFEEVAAEFTVEFEEVAAEFTVEFEEGPAVADVIARRMLINRLPRTRMCVNTPGHFC
jgi:hypothetical protein